MANVKEGKYSKPSAINPVSIGVFLALIGVGFYLFHVGPLYLRRWRVKQVMHQTASSYYKISKIRDNKSLQAQESANLTAGARKKIIEILGFEDPELGVDMSIDEEKKLVNVTTQYSELVTFTPFKTQRIFRFTVVGESDYTETGF